MLRYINQVSFFKDYYDNASSKIFHWSFAMLISEKHEWDCTPCNSIRKYCVNCNGIVFQSYIHESLSCSFICNCVEQKIISRKKLFLLPHLFEFSLQLIITNFLHFCLHFLYYGENGGNPKSSWNESHLCYYIFVMLLAQM